MCAAKILIFLEIQREGKEMRGVGGVVPKFEI